MAGLYAVWHGPDGIRRIATRVQRHTAILRAALGQLGIKVVNDTFFDTLLLETGAATPAIAVAADFERINLRRVDGPRLAVDRTSVLAGKGVPVRVDIGGCRI